MHKKVINDYMRQVQNSALRENIQNMGFLGCSISDNYILDPKNQAIFMSYWHRSHTDLFYNHSIQTDIPKLPNLLKGNIQMSHDGTQLNVVLSGSPISYRSDHLLAKQIIEEIAQKLDKKVDVRISGEEQVGYVKLIFSKISNTISITIRNLIFDLKVFFRKFNP